MVLVGNLLLMGLGFLLLIKGADFVVDGASGIARKLNIPKIIIGLTIVAMGTSAPEAAVSIASALAGSTDITVGNIVGSNILNIFIILGASAVIASLGVTRSVIEIDIPVMIGASVLLLCLGVDGKVSFSDALILLLGFIGYMTYLFMIAKNKIQDEDDKNEKQLKLWQAIVFTVGGITAIVIGSDISVDAATEIAKTLGVSERVIGLTIVALGTSLPEFVTSVAAAKKNNVDIALGNVVGSNIINILLIIGLSGVIAPVTFVSTFLIDMAVVILAGFLVYGVCVSRKKIDRTTGIIMLVLYGAYFLFLLFE